MNRLGSAAIAVVLIALYHGLIYSGPPSRPSPRLQLTYFSGAGRGELSRLVLTFGGVDFDDNRLAGEQFRELKPSLPLGQVPVLSVDGVTYSQSMAITRYAAKLTGLYPTDPLECLRVDMISESLVDVRTSLYEMLYRVKDPEEKAEKSKKLTEELIPKTMRLLESFVRGEFFLGDARPSYADLFLFDLVTNALTPNMPEFSIAVYPKLSALVENVATHPNIAAYLAKHKKDS